MQWGIFTIMRAITYVVINRLDKIKKILLPKMAWAILSVVLLVVIILAVMRACSADVLWNMHVFRIARDKTWYPIQLFDKERNMLAFSDDLLTAIARQEKLSFELLSVGTENLFLGLDLGNYDGIFTSLAPDPKTREKYLFSDPFYRIGPVLIVPYASNVASVSDMEGKIIGVRTGSSLVFNIQQYPNILIRSYDNVLLAFMDLEKNVIDGVILDGLTAYIYTSGIFDKRLKIATGPLTDVGLRLIAKHSPLSQQLIEHFNTGLKEIQANGIYTELVLKWGLYNPELRNTALESHPSHAPSMK